MNRFTAAIDRLERDFWKVWGTLFRMFLGFVAFGFAIGLVAGVLIVEFSR